MKYLPSTAEQPKYRDKTMKSAKQWVDQFSQSGAFDMVKNCKEAEFIVRQIQLDAVNELDIRMRQKMNQVFGELDFASDSK